MTSIYVGNLAHSATEDDLRQAFGQFGEVSAVNIITDRETGRSRGFAFVEMPDNDQANRAAPQRRRPTAPLVNARRKLPASYSACPPAPRHGRTRRGVSKVSTHPSKGGGYSMVPLILPSAPGWTS
jgi:hypothetical protein